jgi:hypothetical protein
MSFWTKWTTANKRFGVRRGVRPQKVLSGFESFTPVRTFVNPALRQAAATLCVSWGQRSGQWRKNIEIINDFFIGVNGLRLFEKKYF